MTLLPAGNGRVEPLVQIIQLVHKLQHHALVHQLVRHRQLLVEPQPHQLHLALYGLNIVGIFHATHHHWSQRGPSSLVVIVASV